MATKNSETTHSSPKERAQALYNTLKDSDKTPNKILDFIEAIDHANPITFAKTASSFLVLFKNANPEKIAKIHKLLDVIGQCLPQNKQGSFQLERQYFYDHVFFNGLKDEVKDSSFQLDGTNIKNTSIFERSHNLRNILYSLRSGNTSALKTMDELIRSMVQASHPDDNHLATQLTQLYFLLSRLKHHGTISGREADSLIYNTRAYLEAHIKQPKNPTLQPLLSSVFNTDDDNESKISVASLAAGTKEKFKTLIKNLKDVITKKTGWTDTASGWGNSLRLSGNKTPKQKLLSCLPDFNTVNEQDLLLSPLLSKIINLLFQIKIQAQNPNDYNAIIRELLEFIPAAFKLSPDDAQHLHRLLYSMFNTSATTAKQSADSSDKEESASKPNNENSAQKQLTQLARDITHTHFHAILFCSQFPNFYKDFSPACIKYYNNQSFDYGKVMQHLDNDEPLAAFAEIIKFVESINFQLRVQDFYSQLPPNANSLRITISQSDKIHAHDKLFSYQTLQEVLNEQKRLFEALITCAKTLNYDQLEALQNCIKKYNDYLQKIEELRKGSFKSTPSLLNQLSLVNVENLSQPNQKDLATEATPIKTPNKLKRTREEGKTETPNKAIKIEKTDTPQQLTSHPIPLPPPLQSNSNKRKRNQENTETPNKTIKTNKNATPHTLTIKPVGSGQTDIPPPPPMGNLPNGKPKPNFTNGTHNTKSSNPKPSLAGQIAKGKTGLKTNQTSDKQTTPPQQKASWLDDIAAGRGKLKDSSTADTPATPPSLSFLTKITTSKEGLRESSTTDTPYTAAKKRKKNSNSGNTLDRALRKITDRRDAIEGSHDVPEPSWSSAPSSPNSK